MHALVTIVAVIAVVGFVVGRQLVGEPLRGRRVVLLPAVLTVIGISELGGAHQPVRPADVAFLVFGGLLVIGVGIAQGSALRLEARNGVLWGQLPVKGLWLWVLLVGTRLVLTGGAELAGAHVAASTSTILLMLGLNRLGQAAVVVTRAMGAGISFAPEKNGSTFLAGLTPAGLTPSSPTAAARPGGTARTDRRPAARQVAVLLEQRRGVRHDAPR